MEKKELQDFREQREVVRRHLAWIDAKIAAIEAESSDLVHLASHSNESVEDSYESPLLNPDSFEDTSTVVSSSEGTHDDEIESAMRSYGREPRTAIRSAKLGCIAIFIGAVSLFLFLLFGLPYLMD